MVNQKEYLRLQASPEEGIEINSPGKTLIALPVKITYNLLFQIADELRKEDKASCYLMGELRFSDGRKDRGGVPFAFSGEFPIFKELDIEFVALKSNELTIGGADLNFEVKFTNRNGFSRVILRCLEKDKEKRYQSAGELRSELKNIEEGTPITEKDAKYFKSAEK